MLHLGLETLAEVLVHRVLPFDDLDGDLAFPLHAKVNGPHAARAEPPKQLVWPDSRRIARGKRRADGRVDVDVHSP
ncbi:hypothetical protein GCM10009556_098440 [Acrocarpospora pleiomorpha]